MSERSFHVLLDKYSADVQRRTSEIVGCRTDEVVEQFYGTLLQDETAQLFLDGAQVRSRLRCAFLDWAQKIFAAPEDLDPEDLTQHHLRIGIVHERIGIPMHLVSYGIQMVRDKVLEYILDTEDLEDRVQVVRYTNNLLDTCQAVMNRSYFEHSLESERNSQLLRYRMAHSDIMLECERMRSELISWTRDVMISFAADPESLAHNQLSVYNSPFGMWLNHKAALYFPEFEEVKRIRFFLMKLDRFLEDCRVSDGGRPLKNSAFFNGIKAISDQIDWLMDQLIERILAEYNSKDALTQLTNRRFLEGVLKREIELSRKTDEVFGVMMLDIDDFKPVNDTYGHRVGDMVLQKVAGLIMDAVRATDFCFRYGGEEFLVVATNTTVPAVATRAEAIRRAVEAHGFELETGEKFSVTISIGTAVYSGHPDYQLLVEEADQNLYRAKHNGKNCVVSPFEILEKTAVGTG